jgi:hypothetical protein
MTLTIGAVAITASIAGAAVNWSASAAVSARLARITANGQPVALMSNVPPDVDPMENAGPHLLAAFEGLDPALASLRLDARLDAAPAGIVEKHAPSLAAARAALRRARCRFDIDYALGANALLRHIAPLMLGAKLFLAESASRRAADPSGAADSCLDLLRLANALREEPVLVTQLVRCAMINGALLNLDGLPMTAAQRAELVAIADTADLRGGLQAALMLDRCMVIAVYEDALAGHAPGMGVPSWMSTWIARPVVRRDFARYLGAMEELLRLSGERYCDARGAMESIEASLSGISLVLAPAVSRACRAAATAQARFDLATGRTDRPDPFSGKPYFVQGNVVRSAGDGITWTQKR